jgi:hypothetical protein
MAVKRRARGTTVVHAGKGYYVRENAPDAEFDAARPTLDAILASVSSNKDAVTAGGQASRGRGGASGDWRLTVPH